MSAGRREPGASRGCREPTPAVRPPLGAQAIARAAEINEAVAGEFTERGGSPLENPLLERLAELGVETDVAVGVALERAQRIACQMRRGRLPRDDREFSDHARVMSPQERAQVAALAVAWWDGLLTALRASELERRGHRP